jgi:hypothetical protein
MIIRWRAEHTGSGLLVLPFRGELIYRAALLSSGAARSCPFRREAN